MPARRTLSGAILVLLMMVAAPLRADTIYLFGTVGSLPVVAFLQNDKGTLSGWYFYRSTAREIRLSGTIDRDGVFQLDEADNGRKTGIFKGRAVGGRWTGTWQKPAGSALLPLTLGENHDLLKNFGGRFRCSVTEPRPEFSYTYKWDLELGIANGVVKALDSTQGPSGDEQLCWLGLKELQQIPSKAGILLRARADDPASSHPGCTVRILGNEDTVWVQFGAPFEDGNDCRRAGDTMYCSPRAFWNDFVIDRQTGKCKALQ